MTHQSSLKKILSNAAIVLSGNMGANIINLLSVAIFAHSMGAEIFGYYVLILMYVEILDRLFNFQTWQAFIKYATDFRISKENHNLSMLLKYTFLVDVISLTVAFLVASFSISLFVRFFELPIEYEPLVQVLVASIFFKIFEISTGIFRLFDQFKFQTIIIIYSAVTKFLLFGVIALTSPTFDNFVYATFVSLFVGFLMKLLYSKNVLNRNGFEISEVAVASIDFRLIREKRIFSFIIYNNFDVAVRMVSRQFDVAILGRLYGAETVGVFSIAKEIASIIARLTDPIYQAIYPEFALLLAGGRKLEAKAVAKKVSLYAGLAGIGCYILFAVLGKFAIVIAFGEEFLAAYGVTLVYFGAIFIAIISLPLVPTLHSKGLAKEAFGNQSLATIGYLIVIYPLTVKFMAIGASASYIVFYSIWLLLTLRTIKKHKVFA